MQHLETKVDWISKPQRKAPVLTSACRGTRSQFALLAQVSQTVARQMLTGVKLTLLASDTSLLHDMEPEVLQAWPKKSWPLLSVSELKSRIIINHAP